MAVEGTGTPESNYLDGCVNTFGSMVYMVGHQNFFSVKIHLNISCLKISSDKQKKDSADESMMERCFIETEEV